MIYGSRDLAVPFALAILFLLVGSLLLSSLKTSNRRTHHFYTSPILCMGTFIALSTCFFRFTIDDAYISLRYARNFANGYGLVYSIDGSPPVEGYTNFLWVLIEAPLFLLNLPDHDILHAVKLMGITFGIASIFAAGLLTYQLTDDKRAGLLCILLLSAIPQLSFWAIGGLETTMYIFWLLSGLSLYVFEVRHSRMHIASMLFFTLMSLTRPEGLFFVVALLLWELMAILFIRKRPFELLRTSHISSTLVFVLPYSAYFLWRYHYYGYLLPNTFYARSGAFSVGQVLFRLSEMRPFIIYLLPLFTLACVGFLKINPSHKRERALLSFSLVLLVAFCFASKREWMPGNRYELPFVPILVLFAAVGIHNILLAVENWQICRRDIFAIKVGMLFCFGLYLVYPTLQLQKSKHYTDDLTRAHITLGKWLRQYAPKDASYASWDMGAVPYYSRLPKIIEIHPEGILSSYITHNKYDVNYFLALTPSFIVLPQSSNSRVNSGLLSFYSNDVFLQNYEYLFSFGFRKNYILTVYSHRKIHITQSALAEGKELAKQSLAQAYISGR